MEIISLLDARNYSTITLDNLTEARLQIVLMSEEATKVAKEVLNCKAEQISANNALSYNSDDEQEGIISADRSTLNTLREFLEEKFGKPATTTSPIFALDYPERENEHWAVWSQDVYVDKHNEIIEFVQN